MMRASARLVACALCALVIVVVRPFAQPRQTPPSAELLGQLIGQLIDRYDRGEHDAVARAIRDLPVDPIDRKPVNERSPFDSVFLEFRKAATPWIAATSGAAADRRRLVAATFALELAHARPAVNWRLRSPLIVWACELLRREATHLPAERWWYLASIGVIEEAGDWHRVVGAAWSPPTKMSIPLARPHFFSTADQDDYSGGHLAHARAAFPDEPRFLLAQVHAEEAQTSLHGAGIGPSGINGEETSPAVIAMLQQALATRKTAPGISLDPNAAQLMLDRINGVPAVARAYSALSQYPSLRGDVELHLGYLAIRLEDWTEALTHLRQVPRVTNEPFLIGLSHHFAGWVLQRTGHQDAAISEYQMALDLAPRARSVSILLAAQLAQVGRQDEGYTVLDAALNASPSPPLLPSTLAPPADAPPDPWMLYASGDAGLVPVFLAHLRGALK